MKKKTCLIMVIILSISCTTFAAAFPDIQDDNWNWAKSSIEEMNSTGIITGFPDGTFRPSEGVTKLQALILIARILGVNQEENAQYVSLAEEAYQDVLLPYAIYNKREVAYLLYKGILHPNELINYITPSNANAALQRYEAAILLTKALGMERQVQSKLMTVLPYHDVQSIPAHAKPYVECVKDQNIMGGMSENEFGPLVNVTRAQMAVMLHRVMKKNELTDYISSGIVTEVDESNSTITVKNVIDVQKVYSVNENVILRLDGAPADLSDFTPKMQVKVTLKSEKLYMVEGVSPEIDETVEGVITYLRRSSRTRKIKIRVTEEDTTTTQEYNLDDDVEVVYEGEAASLSDISTYDYATLEIKNGLVKKITAEKRNKKVEGVVQAIILEPTLVIQIKVDHDKVEEYEVLSDVTVEKNNRDSDLRSIRVGDKVELNLEYNKVEEIEAESVRGSTEGIIEEILISKTPFIKIKKQDKITQYSVAREVEITIDGNKTKDDIPYELYDLRLGYPVELTIDSDIVIEIEAKTLGQAQQMTGSVELVNESYGFLNIVVVDAMTGETISHQIFVKDGAKIVDSNSSRILDLDDIEVGDIVTVIGSTNTGVFEAKTIVVISE